MHYNWSSYHWMLPEKTQLIILKAHVRVSKWVGNQISQVAQMSLFLERSAMVFTQWVVMRSSCDTSFSQVSEFVNVNSVFTVWIKALDWACNFDWGCRILLTERNDTSDFWAVRVQYADGISGGLWSFRLVHKIWNWAGGTSKGQTEFSQHCQRVFYKMGLIYYKSQP